MSEENKAVYRRFMEEVFNRRNAAAIDQYLAADVVDHAAPPGTPPGVEGAKHIIPMYLNAFPDVHATIEDLIAEGDKVVARYSFAGTHRGEFLGLAPTGKQFTITGIDIVRVAGGKIVEHWEVMDQMGMMQQLGLVPPPGQAGG